MARYGYLKPLIIPLCLFVLTGALFKLEEFLLNTEILNKKDLGFVGDESGTFYEYITNIWYWDAALLLLTILAVLLSVSVFLILLHRKTKAKNEKEL